MYNFHNKYDSKNKNNPSVVEKKNSENKKAVKDEVKIKDENVDKKDDVNNDDTTSKNNESKETKTNNSNKSNIQSNENKNNQKTTTSEITQPPVQQEEQKEESNNNVKANNPWDILGITEDQYYNKPLYSWERVDFSTYEECANYGESYKPYLNGEELYHCSTVSSASGKNLGWMFHTEKLN
ncbi:unknown [Mycoplasma sp. CAG:472]|nr:unknown [Mycoplasma sp. CAG:472]